VELYRLGGTVGLAKETAEIALRLVNERSNMQQTTKAVTALSKKHRNRRQDEQDYGPERASVPEDGHLEAIAAAIGKVAFNTCLGFLDYSLPYTVAPDKGNDEQDANCPKLFLQKEDTVDSTGQLLRQVLPADGASVWELWTQEGKPLKGTDVIFECLQACGGRYSVIISLRAEKLEEERSANKKARRAEDGKPFEVTMRQSGQTRSMSTSDNCTLEEMIFQYWRLNHEDGEVQAMDKNQKTTKALSLRLKGQGLRIKVNGSPRRLTSTLTSDYKSKR
jgi:hypothetical protein